MKRLHVSKTTLGSCTGLWRLNDYAALSTKKMIAYVKNLEAQIQANSTSPKDDGGVVVKLRREEAVQMFQYGTGFWDLAICSCLVL
ncbi:hypothetical protein AXG93_868s1010 [Marchantia polymorpha subsp. ruderalis]|uniref:Uncharacterized protein n=1 Tax=Marchantia polymorpha subsp. ruderalis TaxID=1480154 RepID=A0A176VK15_MARPO|nr:hypothetical protein AXG93_868s1010 [Marchantia polymorpha subsp. ruderalis]